QGLFPNRWPLEQRWQSIGCPNATKVFDRQRSSPVNFLSSIKSHFAIVGELMSFLWLRRLYWMIPMVFVLLLFGLLVMFTQSSALAPLLYPLFLPHYLVSR